VTSTHAKAQHNITRSGPFLHRDLVPFYSAIDTVQKSLAPMGASIHAEIGLRLDFALPRTKLAYSHCSGNAKSGQAIEEGSAD